MRSPCRRSSAREPSRVRRGTSTTAWSCALQDPNTLVIRVPLSRREALLETYPDSFGVPPRMESHHKVEAYLDRAQPHAVFRAIDLAWELQRSVRDARPS